MSTIRKGRSLTSSASTSLWSGTGYVSWWQHNGIGQPRSPGSEEGADNTYPSAPCDTRRAAQTANEIGTALALPVQLLPSLREGSFNIGSQSGIKTEEGNQQESVQAFQQRVSESVDGIVSEWPEECTVVVAHSGTIRAALHHLLQSSLVVV